MKNLHNYLGLENTLSTHIILTHKFTSTKVIELILSEANVQKYSQHF